MDYQQAIELAKAGKEEGFQFLYESTYKSKYYLAVKYAKDEQAAQDILQEAYLRAFTRLDQLEKPEAFPGWLGTIVGNLAKNYLQKKNPLLFSDIAANDQEEPFEYKIKDETRDYQPELSYTRQETQQLVHEMINSLSEEQRVCILMYEIEGIPIKEIARALDCSENTVKSRLNYGRKNLKKQAEELQRKGYKLYGLSPLPLLLLLLRRENTFLSGDRAWQAAQFQTARKIFSQVRASGPSTSGPGASGPSPSGPSISGPSPSGPNPSSPSTSSPGASASPGNAAFQAAHTAAAQAAHTAAPQAAHTAAPQAAHTAAAQATHTAAGAAKSGFIHTMAGKITTVLLSLAVAGGAAGTIYYFAAQSQESPQGSEAGTNTGADTNGTETDVPQEPAETRDPAETQDPAGTQDSTETQDPEEPREMSEADYEALIAGNLTRQEVEYVLAYGPEEIPAQGFTSTDYVFILNQLCQGAGTASADQAGPIAYYGTDSQYRSAYSLADINRLFSAFTDFQFTEGTHEGNVEVNGDAVYFSPAALNFTAEAEITSGEYTDETMTLYFTWHHTLYDDGTRETHAQKKAVLRPTPEGRYRIVEILEAEEAGSGSVDAVYNDVLESVKEQKDGYTFTNALDYTGSIKYFLQDLDQDGIPELIVGAECTLNVFMGMDCRFYSCRKTEAGYSLIQLQGSQVFQTLCVPMDGNGLLSVSMDRGTGMYDLSRVSVQDNAVTLSPLPEYQFRLGDAEEKTFWEENPAVSWMELP